MLISVSHELRTPLTLILGPLDDCIDDASLVQAHRSRLTLVRRNARRLLRLVNSLLDISRLEAGKMSAAFRETRLQRYTTDLASLFRSGIEKGGVEFEVKTDGKDEVVWVDRDMWEVSTSNLFRSDLENHIQRHWKCLQIHPVRKDHCKLWSVSRRTSHAVHCSGHWHRNSRP